MSSPSAAGKVITFYSYKGGTGRSMLLANVAWLLACNRKRVLTIDWDLEAPGLHRYFKPFIVDPDLVETEGLIDIVWTLASRALPDEKTKSSSDLLASVQIDIDDYINPLTWNFATGGCIDFIGAGRQGATYSERVNTFDWKRFYQLGGRTMLERLKSQWVENYDFILIDSRTGVSDTSGICTIEMPDAVVACLTLNRQSIEGVAAILQSVRTWESQYSQSRSSKRVWKKAIDFFPVATRIENSEKDKLDVARARVRETFQPFLRGQDSSNIPAYWDAMEVTYRPYYAYEEVLAAFGDASGAQSSAKSLSGEIENIGRRLIGDQQLAMAEIPEPDRRQVLADYALGSISTKPAESTMPPVPRSPLQETTHDDDFLREIYSKEVYWRTTGYQYRSLLSQRELQLITEEERTRFGRQMIFYHDNSLLVPKLQAKANWMFYFFWLALILVAGFVYLVPMFTPDSMYIPYTYRTVLPIVGLGMVSLATIARSVILKGEAPYGMTVMDIALACFLGPLSMPIRDGQPNQRQLK